jgi:hypothetical protein
MTPRTAIAQIAKMIGQELESGAGPSEGALAAGPILAEAGATTEIVGRLFAEARRKRPNDRMIDAYAFMLEATLGTLRVQASGGDVGADHAIAEVRRGLDYALPKGGVAPEVLMLVARAFARAASNINGSPRIALTTVVSRRRGLSRASIHKIRLTCRIPSKFVRPRSCRSALPHG